MPMTPLKELGQKLKAARKKKGLTQQQLADISHVSLKHIQNCERGKKNPSGYQLSFQQPDCGSVFESYRSQ